MRTQSSLLNLRTVLKPLFTLSLVWMTVGMAQAQAGWFWKAPDHGFRVEIEASSIPQKSGAPAKITGEIQYLHAHSEGKKPAPAGILDQVDVRAYFPDFAHEVTKDLILDSKRLTFTYTTPNLKRDDLNVFTVVVGRIAPESQGLQKVQAKLEKRIAALEAALRKGKAQKVVDSELSKIQALRDELKAVSDKIGERLSTRLETLAKTQFPLQVDNLVSAPSLQSSLVGGFQIDLSMSLGSAIEGESTQAKASITNFRKKLKENGVSFQEDSSDLSHWVTQFFWKGTLVKEFFAQPIPAGKSLTYTHPTGKLSSADLNVFKAAVYKAGDSGQAARRFGALSTTLPVAQDSLAPKWLTGSTPDEENAYVQAMQPVFALVKDEFGLVDPTAFQASLIGNLVNGSVLSKDVTSQLAIQSPDQGQSYAVNGNLNPLEEGLYTFTLKAKDLAGNQAQPDPLARSFRVDRTAPSVILGVSDHLLTNVPAWNVPVTVFDHSPTVIEVLQNGQLVARSSELNFNVPITLKEGPNFIEVRSRDAAGNEAPAVQLTDIVLDTIPPVLSDIKPKEGQILNTLSFGVSAKSNEPLFQAQLNGAQELTLSSDKKSFSGTYKAVTEGPVTLTFRAVDLAGNPTQVEVNAQVILKVLNENLLSVAPDPEGLHLWIRGAPGASRPGLTVKAQGSFFNRGSAVAEQDGSFAIKLLAFQEASVTATDPTLPRTDTATVRWGLSQTYLSGVVKDTEGNPLAGAKVGIAGTAFSVQTGADGVFVFANPISGDQLLTIDGSTVVESSASLVRRKFSKTNISISIGLNESNVLERPIYLAPLILDGSETPIMPNQEAVVVSPHAPGVKLKIPSGAATFPGAMKSGEISMITIPSEVATTAPLEVAVPTHVVALEPSGVSFSEPVELTLPNDNDLPKGTEVVILSMNSQKGIWEIDGAAKVTEDGQSVVTKPGMGIRHFSLVYAAPLGPKVAQMGAQDKPGTNTFDGALSTSIELPSYKVLGTDLTPRLAYKSHWARPSVLVTNVFDIPREEVTFEQGGAGGVFTLYRKEVTVGGRAYIEPRLITAEFATTGLQTDPSRPIEFTGNPMPNKLAISFAADLKDPETGEFFSTNLYPYTAHYKIYLKQMVVGTKRTRRWKWFKKPEVVQENFEETRLIEEAFPSDLDGSFMVQNHVRSPAGRGWRISGVQKIVNPEQNKILIEEGDGSISTYGINDTIGTLFNAEGSSIDFSQSVDFSQWPRAFAAGSSRISQIDLSSGQIVQSNVGTIPEFAGSFWTQQFWHVEDWHGHIKGWDRYDKCWKQRYDYRIGANLSGILTHPDGSVYGLDYLGSRVFRLQNGGYSRISGGSTNAPTFVTHTNNVIGNTSWDSDPARYCSGTHQVSCSTLNQQVTYDTCFHCCGANISDGSVPSHEFAGESTNASAARLNHPRSMTAGPRPNTIVFADTGNNRVRMIDLVTNQITTIAGNGSISDYGDDGAPLAAGMFHPRGVIYDALGNLYISTENGQIRKVDPTGSTITTIVGAPGATPGENWSCPQLDRTLSLC